MRYVTLVPSFRGPTAGYQAVLVDDHGGDEWLDEPDRTAVRYGPWSDAMLVARARAIDWARRIGEPVERGI